MRLYYNFHEDDEHPPEKNVLRAIRKHCLECVCGVSKEVELCTSTVCWLYPFRFGTNPFAKPASKARQAASRKALEKARAALAQEKKPAI